MNLRKSNKEQTPAPRGKLWQFFLAAVAGLVLLLSLSVVIYWGITGVTDVNQGMDQIAALFLPRQNNVYRKDSYTVSDEKAASLSSRVVASVEDGELTNGVLQIYYWMEVFEYLENNGYDAMYNGLDYTQPLDQQRCLLGEGTWQQFFLERALSGWHQDQALAKMASAEGISMDKDLNAELNALRGTMTESAIEGGYSGLDALVQSELGPGCTFDDYYAYMKSYYTGYSYLNRCLKDYAPTEAQLETYYAEHLDALTEQGSTKEAGKVVDIRHILIPVEGGTENEDGEILYSDSEWETCRLEAKRVMDQWVSEEPTEEHFAELAQEYSQDAGSNENGGLYESLDAESGFVPEFIQWYMSDARYPGEYGLLRTEYGYHVMYFSGSEAKWLRNCRQLLLAEKTAALLTDATEGCPMEVTYKNIALGEVDFNQE